VVTQPSQAQTDPAAGYPNKPIRMIVPFAAGGGNDIFARLVGNKAAEIPRPAVRDREPAGGRRPGRRRVRGQPAGRRLHVFIGASGVMSISAAVYPQLHYHPTKSLVPLVDDREFPADHG
jgi:tripartite-type tricarboxylate transporter receptor subunit TctC